MSIFKAIVTILIETIKSLGYIVIGVTTIFTSMIRNTFYITSLFIKQLVFGFIKTIKTILMFFLRISFFLIKLPIILLFKLFRVLNKVFKNIFIKTNTKTQIKEKSRNKDNRKYKELSIKNNHKDKSVKKNKQSEVNKTTEYYEIVLSYGFIFNFINKIKFLLKAVFNVLKLFFTFISKLPFYFFKKLKKIYLLFISIFGGLAYSLSNFLKNLKKVKFKNTSAPLKKQNKGTDNFKSLNVNVKKRFGIWPFILGILFSLVFIMAPFEIYLWFRELPKPELLVVEGGKKPTRILDKNGKLLYEIYVDKKFDPVALDKIPSNVINATLAVEDSEFYNHSGIRLDRILKAAKSTIWDGEKQGASTITQQLIKNVLLTPERTVSRKVKEVVLSFFVESKYTKDQILELYLNNISYGGVAWGIQSASQKYFGKNVWELTLAEASMLAGLPSAPSAFSPLVDINLAKQRQLHVLNRMNELGYITKTELVTAYDEELVFANQVDFIRAPHFVQLVRNELEQTYGKREVEYGGFTVTTTLDLDLQQTMETIVKEEIEKSKGLNLTNGSSVVLDIKTGGIIGYVGSVDYFKEGWGAFDVASAYRQPGSSIKPITYALALEKGFTPATIIPDEKISYPQANGKPYVPVNYDGKFHGDVTLRSALANSYNIPAVKLANSVGPDTIVNTGRNMGLENWNADGNYGLSITLGGKEVKLLDHTNVFATFGRQGIHKDVTPFISIKDSKGYELYRDTRVDTKALSKESSYLIWDILSDNNARLPAFGVNNYLSIPNHKVAVKTGTTDNKRDNWTMGFTPSYSIGVWVGNNDNTPMSPSLASGLTGAAPIWNRITTEVLKNITNETPPMPDTVFKKYDEKCNRSELFIKGSNVPQSLCPQKPDENKDKDDKDKDSDD